jgi:N6-adenosine-specific RNA methylase IME4
VTELVLFNRARMALEKARTIDEVKDIVDKALAITLYAKVAKDTKLIEDATEIRLRAERRAGEMIAALGERRGRRKTHGETSFPSNEEIGVTDQQSYLWQKLGALAQEDFERRVAEAQKRAVDSIESTAEERKMEKQQRRAEHEANLAHQIRALPTKKFGVILSDPAWKFIPWNEDTGNDRSASNHYATSRLDEIKSRDVESISADDCVLFMWATVPMLPQALEVMAHWGFEYRSHFCWLKDQVGTGYWSRNVHELLLVGVRGRPPAPAPGTQYESAWDAPVGEHSEKPSFAYELIESYFPNLPKIELDARQRRESWDAWGAGAPIDLEDAAE